MYVNACRHESLSLLLLGKVLVLNLRNHKMFPLAELCSLGIYAFRHLNFDWPARNIFWVAFFVSNQGQKKHHQDRHKQDIKKSYLYYTLAYIILQNRSTFNNANMWGINFIPEVIIQNTGNETNPLI